MWQAELPLHEDLLQGLSKQTTDILPAMTMAERLSSDFAIQGASSGPHPMKLWRAAHEDRKILRAVDLHKLPHGIP